MESGEVGLSIYPNPASHMLYVRAPYGSELVLMDLNGRTIAKRSTSNIEEAFDLSELAQGVYLLEWMFEGNSYREKVIKQ